MIRSFLKTIKTNNWLLLLLLTVAGLTVFSFWEYQIELTLRPSSIMFEGSPDETGLLLFDEFSVCPGETITYEIRGQIVDAPVNVGIQASWWNVDKRRTAIYQRTGDIPRTTWPTVGEIFVPLEIDIPDLDPGHYLRITAINSNGTELAAYAAPVTIRENCD